MRLTSGEALLFLFFPVGVIVGFVVAWSRELAGGVVTVLSLALFGAYLFVAKGQILGGYFFLFAAPGFLHLASALLHHLAKPGRQNA